MKIKKGKTMLKLGESSNVQQGLIYTATGTIVLLYALGIIGESINALVIAVSVGAIIIGCIKLGLFKTVAGLFGHTKKH